MLMTTQHLDRLVDLVDLRDLEAIAETAREHSRRGESLPTLRALLAYETAGGELKGTTRDSTRARLRPLGHLTHVNLLRYVGLPGAVWRVPEQLPNTVSDAMLEYARLAYCRISDLIGDAGVSVADWRQWMMRYDECAYQRIRHTGARGAPQSILDLQADRQAWRALVKDGHSARHKALTRAEHDARLALLPCEGSECTDWVHGLLQLTFAEFYGIGDDARAVQWGDRLATGGKRAPAEFQALQHNHALAYLRVWAEAILDDE